MYIEHSIENSEMATTSYAAYKNENNDSINTTHDERFGTERFGTDIISPILSDETLTQKERNHLVRVFNVIATNLKDAPTHSYISVENENYCLPRKRAMTGGLEKRNIPRNVSENVFIITFIWQLICVTGLEAVDLITKHEIDKEKPYCIAAIVVMIIFEISNLVFCLSVTVKLFKQYKHKNTSMKFLLHAYIASLFLFGGMYAFTAWIFPDVFSGLSNNKTSKFRALYLYSQLLFMSISTGTLCGASKVTAAHVTTELMMSFQMLLSFLYFASIISEALNPSVVDNVKKKIRKFRMSSAEHSITRTKKQYRKMINV